MTADAVVIAADTPLRVRLQRGHLEAAMPFHPTRRRLLAASALGADPAGPGLMSATIAGVDDSSMRVSRVSNNPIGR